MVGRLVSPLPFTLLAVLLSAQAGAVSGSRADGEKKLQQTASDYGLQIDIAGFGTKVDSGVTCSSMSSTHVTLALPIFLPQMKRYPRDFFSSAGIQRMVLCGDLVSDGRKLGGLAIGGRTFYLNLKSANLNAKHAARVFHHEVFHLVDVMDDGEWGRIRGGFISDYAKTGPREDRAELFSEMMVNARGVASKSASNPALKQKAQLIDRWVEAELPDLSGQLRKGR